MRRFFVPHSDMLVVRANVDVFGNSAVPTVVDKHERQSIGPLPSVCLKRQKPLPTCILFKIASPGGFAETGPTIVDDVIGLPLIFQTTHF